ncbi:hypothetical protein Dsin_020427 [Dipteronia sinensis]|uniref:Uncharacterized protein n=1 Tax=Dipteronia sinensis TaxID=43782 RepID=A0AAE0E3Z7_9ROSI|nr:hypothetical protein Dsin_020427 [Dipteronia sinensis]
MIRDPSTQNHLFHLSKPIQNHPSSSIHLSKPTQIHPSSTHILICDLSKPTQNQKIKKKIKKKEERSEIEDSNRLPKIKKPKTPNASTNLYFNLQILKGIRGKRSEMEELKKRSATAEMKSRSAKIGRR